MYVRHGDKGKEAKLYEDAEYEDALNQLRTLEPGLTHQVFLSTEDPATVHYFTNSTRGWQTTYVDMPRKPNRYEVGGKVRHRPPLLQSAQPAQPRRPPFSNMMISQQHHHQHGTDRPWGSRVFLAHQQHLHSTTACRKKSNLAYMQENGFANEMLDGLLNLDLSLRCDGFVSGVSSNWAR